MAMAMPPPLGGWAEAVTRQGGLLDGIGNAAIYAARARARPRPGGAGPRWRAVNCVRKLEVEDRAAAHGVRACGDSS